MNTPLTHHTTSDVGNPIWRSCCTKTCFFPMFTLAAAPYSVAVLYLIYLLNELVHVRELRIHFNCHASLLRPTIMAVPASNHSYRRHSMLIALLCILAVLIYRILQSGNTSMYPMSSRLASRQQKSTLRTAHVNSPGIFIHIEGRWREIRQELSLPPLPAEISFDVSTLNLPMTYAHPSRLDLRRRRAAEESAPHTFLDVPSSRQLTYPSPLRLVKCDSLAELPPKKAQHQDTISGSRSSGSDKRNSKNAKWRHPHPHQRLDESSSK